MWDLSMFVKTKGYARFPEEVRLTFCPPLPLMVPVVHASKMPPAVDSLRGSTGRFTSQLFTASLSAGAQHRST